MKHMPRVATFLKSFTNYHVTYPTEQEAAEAKKQPQVSTEILNRKHQIRFVSHIEMDIHVGRLLFLSLVIFTISLLQRKKLVKNACMPPGQVSLKVTCPSHINNCYLSLKMPAAEQVSFQSYLPSSKVTYICSWAGIHFHTAYWFLFSF